MKVELTSGHPSGAGKTESVSVSYSILTQVFSVVQAKYIMRYLASINPPDSNAKTRTKLSLDESSEVERQILATNPVLEAFGNAKTTRNDNSSRFGKYIQVRIMYTRRVSLKEHSSQILFDGRQEICGARIRTYLLERSRIVFQPLTERNYHIFYQLCAGAPLKERKDLGLDTDINKFHYLRQGGPQSTPIVGVDDAEEFRTTQQALSTIGISVEQQWAVFRLLAALLHLGNVKITQARSDASIDENDTELLLATRFLGIDKTEFKKWTVKKQITTRSEKIITALNAAQATVVRDSVAKFVYVCLFEWLVAIVNESLAGENGEAEKRAEMFIGVLDIYGFEHFQKVMTSTVLCAVRWFVTCPFRIPLNSSALTTRMRSCNKKSVETLYFRNASPDKLCSLMRMSSNSNKRNMSRRRFTGSLSNFRIISLALMS